ncbi:hypothetical protein ABZ464_33550 [Streptomyces sp. NPDC005820]|uniref:hypothetical protein n=1 Tax=Streptomyces sp. NPDC005820 TaxID=3157069 RepID=UPI0033FBCEB2
MTDSYQKFITDTAAVRVALETLAARALADDPDGSRRALHRTIGDASDNAMLKRIWPTVEAQINLAITVDESTRLRSRPRPARPRTDLGATGLEAAALGDGCPDVLQDSAGAGAQIVRGGQCAAGHVREAGQSPGGPRDVAAGLGGFPGRLLVDAAEEIVVAARPSRVRAMPCASDAAVREAHREPRPVCPRRLNSVALWRT